MMVASTAGETSGRTFGEFFVGRHVLVTGGAGFIGSHLAERLLALGARVRIFDDYSTGLRSNVDDVRESAPDPDLLGIQEGDLRSAYQCRQACDGIDLVFHQGALGSVPRSIEDPGRSIAVNVGGTACLLAAARDAGIRRVVYASSSSVYGDSESLPKREGEEGRVLSPYAASKRMGEELAELFHRCHGIETVGLRYFNVYGPRQRPDGPYAAVIPRFVDACRSGHRPVIFGDGEQSRDFTWVGDAVTANLLAAVAPAEAWGRAFNVAGGRRVTLLELAAEVCRLTGSRAEPEHAPPRPGDVRHSLADLTLAGELLGYRPQVALADGLGRTVEGFDAASAGVGEGLGTGSASR